LAWKRFFAFWIRARILEDTGSLEEGFGGF